MRKFARLIRDERGVSAVEYGLILSLIVLAMMAGLNTVAGTTINMWNDVATNVIENS